MTFCELKSREVINICDGARLGRICDMELDECTGQLLSLIIPGDSKLFGLIRSDEELVIPYSAIKKLGDDVILVEVDV
ncbi:MAG: YlmC/YmxH family sporulation protein [Clostridia bacterium]|nr:YlmC/YmxH family sporulation protein [Clostridia bacterium]